MKVDFKKLKVSRKYLGGMQMEKSASRRYEYTIAYEGHPLDGMTFQGELHTPRVNEFEWGEGKSTYYENTETEMFDDIQECVLDMEKRRMKIV
jgi:hypothetical protein